MRVVNANGVALHVRDEGDTDGQPVVFANSLGTDLRLWDDILSLLPRGLRLVRYDKRGHGLSQCPPGPYSLDDLAGDAEALIDALGLKPVIFVGLSIGGMIGQRLAARRPDQIKALVLSNTAAKMGDASMWHDRISEIRANGIAPMVDPILDRWFGAKFRKDARAQLWGAMLERTPLEGYLGCCAAIAGSDLAEETAKLRLPVLAIAGNEDGASPPDLVAATAGLIPNSNYCAIDGAGHLPCVEAPQTYAEILGPFLREHMND